MNALLSPLATAVAALFAVLALIWLASRALRTLRPDLPRTGGKTLGISGVLALDARRRVYLITCQDRRVLVLTGGGTDVVLGWLPPEASTGEHAP